jgi:drug/metabolite transporter (DMT)-like permease
MVSGGPRGAGGTVEVMRDASSHPRVGSTVGLLAAASFGLSAPFSQRLVAHCDPELLAGLLYAGAAAVLTVGGRGRRRHEAPLRRSDLPTLTLIMFFGGVAGPVLLLVGLQRVTAVSGSLLLNLEAPLTALLAVVAFREHLGTRGWLAGAAIVLGAAVLGASGSVGADAGGVLLIAGACAAWSIDNNLTQRLTLKDPLAIVRFKAFGAGAVNLLIALALRRAGWPDLWVVAAALGLGAVSYGVSILLDAYALRLVGAAREAALFATAPFAGAIVAIVVLDDPITTATVIAGVCMVAGTAGLLTDRHEHEHAHEPVEHEHRHTHDAHHRHEHPPGVSTEEPHSHPHVHSALVHSHPHASDAHHRHDH